MRKVEDNNQDNGVYIKKLKSGFYRKIDVFYLWVILEFTLLSFIFLWFLGNVKSLASAHMDQHIVYPILGTLVGIVFSIITLLICKIRKGCSKWLLLPIIVVLFGLVSLSVAFGTPCCTGG